MPEEEMDKPYLRRGKTKLDRPLRRLLAITETLLERSRTREELATIGDAVPRDPASVTRDINALRALGWVIESRGGGPYILDSASLPLLVNQAEATALLSMARLADAGGFPDSAILLALVNRIPEAIVRAAEAEADVGIQRGVVDYRQHAPKIDAIRRARAKGRQMRIVYQHPWHESPAEFLVDAAELSWIEGSLILFAYCPKAKGEDDDRRTREFRVDRIASVSVLNDRACIRSAPPKVTFTYRILPELAVSFCPPLDHRMVEELADGSRVFRGSMNTRLRARRYLLALGHQAVALEPASLRDDIADQVFGLAGIYAEDYRGT